MENELLQAIQIMFIICVIIIFAIIIPFILGMWFEKRKQNKINKKATNFKISEQIKREIDNYKKGQFQKVKFKNYDNKIKINNN